MSQRLLADEQTGVRKQRHVELFEDINDSNKDYKSSLTGCVDIADIKDFSFPRRQGGSELYGFTFPIYFVDMPFYAKWLEAEVQRQAIKITRQTLTPADAKDLSADVVFNCLGFGASIVAPDLEAGHVARGILLKIPCEGIYASRWNDEVVSYNYTPSGGTYPKPGGGDYDVYFYPRKNTCILGGFAKRAPSIRDPANLFRGKSRWENSLPSAMCASPSRLSTSTAIWCGS